MAMMNPTGRANYEPNSWSGVAAGPREAPEGHVHFPATETGEMRRVRPERFADHFSQAAQFLASQTDVERTHMANAFTFELGKVKTPAIRARVVSQLLHVDEAFARQVAQQLRLEPMPKPAPSKKPGRIDLPLSPALSILGNPPSSVAGRKLGVLATDGFDEALIKAARKEAKAAGVMLELIAPKIGGVTCDKGDLHPADEKIDGAPSVLYDFVMLVGSKEGFESILTHAPALDFVRDAWAHCKFIAHDDSAESLLAAAGLEPQADEAVRKIASAKDVKTFLSACEALRHWPRESLTFSA